jgi:hypothetical protein
MIRPLRGAVAGTVVLAGFAAPAVALGHSLTAVYRSPLPLAVYLVGAAVTVGLSFAFVLLRDVRADPPDPNAPAKLPPAWIRIGLRVVGLVGIGWIVAQGIAGGSSDASVATLFLWVYGWVAVPMLSAFTFPIWHWLDPFSTLYDIGAWIARRAGMKPMTPAELPAIMRGWPAFAGFAFIVWLELALDQGSSQLLFVFVLGYTAFTLAMMVQFGRDEWRANGETFTFWFRLVGHLAPWGLADETGRLRRRPFASGLLEPGWTRAGVAVIALGIGAIIFDGLSQTEPYFAVFGAPPIPTETVILVGFLGIIVAAALLVTRGVGVDATAAGLLPIAVGYLIAHYLTYLIVDGQRIVVALSDPLQRGADYLGFAFYEPSADWLPAGLVWTTQIAAVVGGHMIGAWAGHAVAARDLEKLPRDAAPADGEAKTRALRLRQVPLAVVMVVLTTVTLWSLGQTIIRPVDLEEDGTGDDTAVVAIWP